MQYYENKVANSSNSDERDGPFHHFILFCKGALLSTIPDESGEIYLKAFKVIGFHRGWKEHLSLGVKK